MNTLKQIVKKINFLKVVEVSAVIAATLIPYAAFALDLPGCGSLRGVNCSNFTLTGLIIYVINIMLALAGVISVLFLIIGGFWYITSAGNEETAEKGKGTVINAIIGIVIVILSYVIVTALSGVVTGGPNTTAP